MIDKIKKHYQNVYKIHGATSKGVDWKNKYQTVKRYSTFLDLIEKTNNKNLSLLDVGCGYGAFYDFIKKKSEKKIDYLGVDLVEEMIVHAQNEYGEKKFSAIDFFELDREKKFDFVIANGLFTQKFDFSNDQMIKFLKKSFIKLHTLSFKAFIFNVLSENVDYKNPKNFYISNDEIIDFLLDKDSVTIDKFENKNLYETFYIVQK